MGACPVGGRLRRPCETIGDELGGCMYPLPLVSAGAGELGPKGLGWYGTAPLDAVRDVLATGWWSAGDNLRPAVEAEDGGAVLVGVALPWLLVGLPA